MANHFKTVLKVAFAVALIYWLVQKGALDFNSLVRLASPSMIALALASIGVQLVANNYRWLRLLRCQGFQTTWRESFELSMIGVFFNFAMPGGIGGDVIKGYYLVRGHQEKKLRAALTIFIDRMVGFLAMIGMAWVAILFSLDRVLADSRLSSIALLVTLFFFGFLGFFVLCLTTVLQRPTIHRFLFKTLPGGQTLHRLYEAIHVYRHSTGDLLLGVGLSVVGQFSTVILIYAIGKALNETAIPFAGYMFLVPVGVVVQALPVAPAGIGFGQAAFYFLFNLYRQSQSQLGPIAMTTMQISSFVWGLSGAYFYLRLKSERRAPAAST
jgi:uncharacterized protein (TIRG00374 family)